MVAQKRRKRTKNKHKKRIENIMEEGEMEFYRKRGKLGGEENE